MPVRHLGFPHELAGVAVDSEQMGVVGNHENAIATPCYATIESLRGIAYQALRARSLEMPDFPASSGVEGPAFIAAGHIHDALNHNGSRLRARDTFHWKNPLRSQSRDIIFINLLKLAVAVTPNVPVVGSPVRLRGRLAEMIPF